VTVIPNLNVTDDELLPIALFKSRRSRCEKSTPSPLPKAKTIPFRLLQTKP
jgi:hypothetical protein